MEDTKIYEAVCECCFCGKKIKVEFLLPPTEEDKIGYACSSCEKEYEEN